MMKKIADLVKVGFVYIKIESMLLLALRTGLLSVQTRKRVLPNHSES